MNKQATQFFVFGGLAAHWVVGYFVTIFGVFWSSTLNVNLAVGSFLLFQAVIAGICLAARRERSALFIAFGPLIFCFVALSVLGEISKLLK